MDAVADQPMLSEVHMETCPPNKTAWCTRFCYRLSDQPAKHSTMEDLDQAHVKRYISATTQDIQDTPAAGTVAGSTYRSQTAHSNNNAGDSAAGIDLDNDGDLVLPSRPTRRSRYVTVHHSLATPVSRCGEQVWLGACLLCDWLLHNRQLLAGQTVVELGAGVGLASILAAQYARQVFLTDGDSGALQLASMNVAENAEQQQHEHHQGSNRPKQQGTVAVRQLDWLQLFDTKLTHLADEEVLNLLNSNSTTSRAMASANSTSTCIAEAVSLKLQVPLTACSDRQQQQPPQQQQQQPDISSYAWSAADLPCLACASIWLAADVVYNETITDAFMRTAYQLMCWQPQQQLQLERDNHSTIRSGVAAMHDAAANPSHQVDLPRLYVAVEKRYNFTYRDLDARASAFEHFLTYVQVQSHPSEHQQSGIPSQRQQQGLPQQQQQLQADYAAGGQSGWQHSSTSAKPLFQGKRLDVSSLPQAMVYDRSADLELWELVPLRQ